MMFFDLNIISDSFVNTSFGFFIHKTYSIINWLEMPFQWIDRDLIS